MHSIFFYLYTFFSLIMHREFPPVAFLAALSLLLPLPWHWRARNVATLSIIAWLFILNIVYGVDAIVWGNNVSIVIPVWCDISAFNRNDEVALLTPFEPAKLS
jgi:hypothetical protein